MMLRTRGLLPVTTLAVCCLAASLAPALAVSAPQTPSSDRAPLTAPRHHATPSHAATAPRTRQGALLAALRRARLSGRVSPHIDVPAGPVEVPRLRTRASTTEVNRNGVYTVHAYLHSINYQDASGAWQPIDNTIIPAKPAVAAAGYAYQNASNNYGVAFAAAGGAALERMTYGGATLTLTPQDAGDGTATVSGSTITYAGLFPRTDARYTVDSDDVKEVLLLHDATAPASFAYTLQIAGARPQASGAVTGGASFVDTAGHSLFALAPMVASDARGATTAVALTLQPAGTTGVYALQATIPVAWLADPARAWPVVLDPTITFNAVKDVTIDSANLGYKLSTFDCVPNRASCPEKTVDGVGYFGTWWPAQVAPAYRSTVMRTLLQFDLSALPPLVTLLDARLQAAIPTRAGNGYVDQTMDASLYPIITGTAWTASATWSTYDGSHAWTTPGGDYDPGYRVTAALDYSHDTYAHDATAIWNITALAQQWYLNQNGASGTRANNGILVRMDDETINSPRKLEWLSGLQVIYNYIPWQGGAAPGGERAFDPHASLKSDRSLVTFPQGDGQQMGVNVSNGDLEVMRNDLSIPSLGIPNVLQRTYHSMAAANSSTMFSPGWQLSVGGDSSLTQGPVGDAIYLDPTGQGYDIPSVGSLTTTNVLTNATTQGNWVGHFGHFGHDGYILNAWNNGGDLTSLPSYVSSYSHPTGTATFWTAVTTTVSALTNPSQTQRNAAALSGSPQTVQVVTFNARELVTASVYLLNWGPPPTSISETVQMQDAGGIHVYQATNYSTGLWVSFTNLQVGPTQPLTVTLIGYPGSSALSSALTFDSSTPDSFIRASGLPADLTQNADGSYALTYNTGLTDHFSSGQFSSVSDRHGNTEHFGYDGGYQNTCPTTQIGTITDTVGRVTTFYCGNSSGGLFLIIDPDNRAVSYGHDSNGNLIDFGDHAAKQTRYQYGVFNASSYPVTLPVTITDPIGNQTVITYDTSLALPRVSAVQDGVGNVTTFTYGVAGTNVTTVTDALGDQTIYNFDPASGVMLSITDANHNTTHFTYDSNMNLLTTTDPLGHVITNTTDSNSNQTGTIDAVGVSSAASYNSLNEPTVVTDTQGQATITQYNSVGDPTRIADPLNNTTIITPAANGEVLARTDANLHTTTYGYDAYGDTVAITDPLGRVSHMSYDTNISRLSATTDAKSQTTTYTYDADDRVIQLNYQDGSIITNTFDADGNITQTIDNSGVTSFVYDGDNRLVQQTYPDGTIVGYSYDKAGRLASKSEPGMPLTTYSYDAGGRLTQVSNSLWGPIKYVYDAASRLTALGYPNGITTTYTQDNANKLTSLSESKGSTTLLGDSFTFSSPGGTPWDLRSSESRNDNGTTYTWSYAYDNDSRLTGATATGGVSKSYTFGYDGVGNLTNDNGRAQSYDAANQIQAAASTSFSFDNNGNLTQASCSSPCFNSTWSYDAQNRTQSYSHHNTSDTYVTNAGGQRAQKSVTQSSGTTTGSYDAELMGLGIYNQTAPVSQTVYYERDPSGRLLVLASTSQAVVTLRGVACPSTTTCYAVGDGGSIISTTNGIAWTPESSGITNTLYGIACPSATTCVAVGDNGTILRTTDGHTWSSQTVGSATLDGITCYTTTQCWVVGSGGTFLHTSDGQTWQSENVGGTNKLMLAITCPFGSTCYAVGALGAIWVSNTAGASWSNMSLSTLQWFTGIACPPPGNLSCYVTGTTGPIRYTSDGFSSVSSQTNPSGATLRALACLSSSTCLAVGSGGAMIETTSSGGTWSTVSSGTAYDLKAVACPSSSTCYAVGAGSTILQTTSAGSTWSWTPEYMQATPYYYGLDGHGSVVNVTDQSGTIQNQYRYDPYGNSLARTENATIANPWQYAGGFYEAESGLYLLGVRYYDPSLGLFLQVDPAGGSTSEYSYAGDDPCNNSDPTGMQPCGVLTAGKPQLIPSAGAFIWTFAATSWMGNWLMTSYQGEWAWIPGPSGNGSTDLAGAATDGEESGGNGTGPTPSGGTPVQGYDQFSGGGFVGFSSTYIGSVFGDEIGTGHGFLDISISFVGVTWNGAACAGSANWQFAV